MKNDIFIPDFANRTKVLDSLCKSYPFIKKEPIGKSRCRRSIYAYTVGNGEKRVLYCGAFHGMEWLTSLVLIKFLKECCIALEGKKLPQYPDLGDYLQIRSLTVIPCINPDGVEISLKVPGKGNWQANAAGVDLNHNFDAGWQELKGLEIKSGITRPCATRYGGERPQSEPEVIALVNYCKKENFSRAVAFHSQGREIYWDFGEDTPAESPLLARLLACAADYKVSAPEGLAVGGGFKDWFISCFKRPAFTVEIGKGKNPLPLSDFRGEYDRLLPLLTLGIIL